MYGGMPLFEFCGVNGCLSIPSDGTALFVLCTEPGNFRAAEIGAVAGWLATTGCVELPPGAVVFRKSAGSNCVVASCVPVAVANSELDGAFVALVSSFFLPVRPPLAPRAPLPPRLPGPRARVPPRSVGTLSFFDGISDF